MSDHRMFVGQPTGAGYVRAVTDPVDRTTEDNAATAVDVSPLFAGRYHLVRPIGEGGFGTVHEAIDQLDGARVAVKRMRITHHDEAARVRREVRALRLLRLPGVVRLRDEGLADGRPYLVMDFVDGLPFPGVEGGVRSALSEERARPLLSALLHTLAQVHTAGVVHRDLKPGNILVGPAPDHRVTLLDFGLSVGRPVGTHLTGEGMVLGTPAYMAPEQVEGRPATAASDLYAVGVMAFESLTGRLPFPSLDARSLMLARVTRAAPLLASVRPDLSAPLCQLVDRLLARRPGDRPRMAGEALALLSGGDPSTGGTFGALPGAPETLPLLGREALLAELLTRLGHRETIALVGPHGSGRSRVVDALAARLRADGTSVLRCFRANTPFRSLGRLADVLADAPGLTLDEAVDRLVGTAAADLADGLVVLVDDLPQVDEWSRAVLAALAGRGGMLIAQRSADAIPVGAAAVNLAPLTAADLSPLFPLPDRLFHLCEDAVALLLARTDGHPGRVATELERWVLLGCARREGPVFRLDRASLERAAMGVAAPGQTSIQDDTDLPAELGEILAIAQLAGQDARESLVTRVSPQPRWSTQAHVRTLLTQGRLERAESGMLRPTRPVPVEDVLSNASRSEIHRRIAQAMPAGASARLYHLVAGGETTLIAPEARTLSGRLLAMGRVGPALAALSEATVALRFSGEIEDLDTLLSGLLGDWVVAAVSHGTAAALDEVLYELCRDATPSRTTSALEALVRAALSIHTAPGPQALERADAVPSFADRQVSGVAPDGAPGGRVDPRLERCRLGVCIAAARRCGVTPEGERVEAGRRWAEAVATPEAHGWYGLWRGQHLYRSSAFDEAAACLGAAVDDLPEPNAQLMARLMQASSLLEAGRLDEAATVAETAGEVAAGLRLPVHELRATWIRRSALYRAATEMAPDAELVELAGQVGVGALEGLVLLNEAAVAWRAGALEKAREWANRAGALWHDLGAGEMADLADALAFAAGAATDARQLEAMVERAAKAHHLMNRLQILCLLNIAGAEEISSRALRTAARGVPERDLRRRWDVVAPMEAKTIQDKCEGMKGNQK